MNFFFFSDTHFNHNNIITLARRPYATIKDMNEDIIYHWNERVKRRDKIWFLGDLAFGNKTTVAEILSRLNGEIHLLIGEHDFDWWKKVDVKSATGDSIFYEERITILKHRPVTGISKRGNKAIVLCHWPMRSWPGMHRGSWHFYGHTHRTTSSWGKSFEVGVDSRFRDGGQRPYPFSLEELTLIMQDYDYFSEEPLY